MTVQLFLLLFGAPLAGAALAFLWRVFRGHRDGTLRGVLAVLAIFSATLGVLSDVVPRLLGVSSLWGLSPPVAFWDFYIDFRFLDVPIVGLLAVIALSLPLGHARGSKVAVLTRRNALTFIRPRWLIVPAVALALLLILSISAGVVSEPEEQTGRYTMWTLEIGGEYSIGTSIYGWFYSLPVLAVILAMLIAAGVSLALIARPAFDDDDEADRQRRTLRSRNVVTAVTATLLLSLSEALGMLAGSASLRGEFGTFTTWTPIAALEPALQVASFVTAALGVACWVGIALTAVPTRTRAHARNP